MNVEHTRCGTPRWVRTGRGQRCVAVCAHGKWKFLPGSVCAEREIIAYTAPELEVLGSTGKAPIAKPHKRRAPRKCREHRRKL